jgi:hypothetical protein
MVFDLHLILLPIFGFIIGAFVTTIGGGLVLTFHNSSLVFGLESLLPLLNHFLF